MRDIMSSAKIALLLALTAAASAWPPDFVRPPGSPHAVAETSLSSALDSIDANKIEADLTFFASDELKGRDTPSPELRVAARFLRARLKRLGLKPAAGDSYFHEYQLSSVSRRRGGKSQEDATLENVCAIWPGSDLASEWIILSAHYDHVGTRGEAIYNGADDNGSGSMALLAMAEALTQYGPMRRSVFFIWVSGEEKGLWGSAAWARDPMLPEGVRAVCNINLDMVGRNAPDSLLITPTRNHQAYNGLTRLAEKLGPFEGFLSLGSADAYWLRSDQVNFSRHLKIPVTFLFAGEHEDYHQPGDTADKIDYDKVRRVSRLVVRMLHAMQQDELDL